MKLQISLLLCLLSLPALRAQYLERTYSDEAGNSLPYRILYPENYDTTQQYPLVFFLHGAGERGSDNEAQLVHGADLFARADLREKYPAIVVFPQCAREDYWVRIGERREGRAFWSFPFYEQPTPSMQLATALLDEMRTTEAVDPYRIYLMGLSMGGFGAFDLLARYPESFAAAAPICGGGNTRMARHYAPHTSLWIFHGAKDEVVPVENSRRMYRQLQQLGAEVRYTEYPQANHNSWDSAFAEKELLPWMFAQSLRKGRYRAPVFAGLRKTTHTYTGSEETELKLDLYLPRGDAMDNRPLLLYMHGGGFAGGRRDEPQFNQFIERLAKMGYAVASMSYRLTMAGQSFGCDQPASNKIRTFQLAVEDIRKATNYVLKHQKEWGVDGNRIVLAGSSAGAEAVLHAAYWRDEDLLPGSPQLPDGFRYGGVISLAGAMVDTSLITRRTAIPTQLFHGTCDNLVPYGTAPHHYCAEGDPGYLVLHGAHSIARRLENLGQPYHLVTGCGGGHEWNDQPLYRQLHLITGFLQTAVLDGRFRQAHRRYGANRDCQTGKAWSFCK